MTAAAPPASLRRNVVAYAVMIAVALVGYRLILSRGPSESPVARPGVTTGTTRVDLLPLFTMLVIMAVATTLATPPLLRLTLVRTSA